MPVREDLFTHTINNLHAGKVSLDLSVELNKLIKACQDTRMKGELKLSLKIMPDKAGEGMYEIKPTIDAVTPKFPTPSSYFWGTPDGNLLTHHPDQGNLELRVATEPKEEAREAKEA